MSIPLDERCSNCRFHLDIPLASQAPGRRLLGKAACLRYPPIGDGVFPEVEETGCWCGEWKGE